MLHTIDIKPKDNFVVLNKRKLSELDKKVVHMLYQPLIGVSATALYFNLLNELREDHMWSAPNSHMFILECTGESLLSLSQSKKKLEGIGLLRTWMKKGVANENFIYEIIQPLSPLDFFKDELMSVLLKQKIGETYFQKMMDTFSGKNVPSDFQEVTASFDSVFEIGTIKPDLTSQSSAEVQFFSNDDVSKSYNFMQMFDFELLFKLLKNNYVNKANFTDEVYETISVLAYLYKIPVTGMSSIILQSSDENGIVDCEKLKQAARENFLFSNEGKLPQLVERVQEVQYRTIFKPETDEERMLFGFETISPLDVLTSLMNGARPSSKELEILESVMVNQKLNPGVMNVLMHYCLQKSDMRLTKNYVETIASTLAKKKIVKVIDAYHFLKESSKPKKNTTNTGKSYPRGRNNVRKEEILPSWYGNENNVANQTQEQVELPEGLRVLLGESKDGGK